MSPASPAPDTGSRMDRMYRRQRYIYDLTRRYYLLGRDPLLRRLASELPQGASLCEVGCGTARNLIQLARLRPDLRLCGIDAAAVMLDTARANLDRAGLGPEIILRNALAEQLQAADFARREGFDAVLFSYTLSMMPDWRRAIDRARQELAPGGVIAVVDFADGRDLPGWFRRILHRWLALFEVRPEPRLTAFLECLAASEDADLRIRSIFGRYAVSLTLRLA